MLGRVVGVYVFNTKILASAFRALTKRKIASGCLPVLLFSINHIDGYTQNPFKLLLSYYRRTQNWQVYEVLFNFAKKVHFQERK